MPLKGCLQTFCKFTNHLMIHQKGMRLNHDFYVVVGKQCSTENAYDGSPIQYLYINLLMLFYFHFKKRYFKYVKNFKLV